MPKKTEAKKVTRCSSLPLLHSCAPAVLNPDELPEVRVENGLENLGTDIHKAIQYTIETGEINLRKIDRMYPKEEAERGRFLFGQGLKVVQAARSEMKNMQFEVEVSFETQKYLVTGHVDVLDVWADGAYIIDFKTGRTRDDHHHQMAGYAVGAWSKMGRPVKFLVRVACVYLEGYPAEEPTVYTFNADDLRQWIEDLDAVDQLRYSVNRRCIYCPLKPSCKVFGAYLNFAVKTVRDTAGLTKGKIGLPGKAIRALPPEQRSHLNNALKVAEMAIKDVRAQIKDETLQRGDMDMGNGNSYTIRLTQKRKLLTVKALEVAKKYLTPKDLTDAMELNLHAVLQGAVRRVRGPMKSVVRDEIEKKLEQAGAIVTSEAPYLYTTNTKGPKWPKGPPTKKKK